jgi:hypothetical protein
LENRYLETNIEDLLKLLCDSFRCTKRQFLQLSGLSVASLGTAALLNGCGSAGQNTASGPPPLPKLVPGEQYVFLEASRFADYGGWSLDTNFINCVGSSYLLAQGETGPVTPAKTRLSLGKAGKYAVFCYCKNWAKDHTPGRFTLGIAGHFFPTEMGTFPAERWVWQKAGEIELPSGEIDIELRDQTGEYGRCRALLLTTDLGFLPPDHLAGVAWLKENTGEVGPEPVICGPYNFVVVGGGVAGTVAAIAAARQGCKVALLQNRPVLGGNASKEVGVRVASAGDFNAGAREGGLVEEIAREAAGIANDPPSGWQIALKNACDRETNLDLFVNMQVTGVQMKGSDSIDAVLAHDTLTDQPYVFQSALFADCTGDAHVGAAAGAKFTIGRESRRLYGEEFAPYSADNYVLGSSLLYSVEYTPVPESFVAPKWARYFDQQRLPYREVDSIGPFWWVEYGGQLDTIANSENIHDELLRIVYGIWDYVKNRSPLSSFAQNYRIKVRPVAGKRESRRLLGDYVLREADLKVGTQFPDTVAFGGWVIDLHALYGIYDPGPPQTNAYRVAPYGIPFRSLYSQNILNLMMAGRDVSVSHVALGSTRVMGTCGTMGQAIGTAAALAAKYKVPPRKVGSEHMGELQKLLVKDDAYLPGIIARDPDDLAPSARVSASSTMQGEVFDASKQQRSATYYYLDHFRGQSFQATMDYLQKVTIQALSTANVPIALTAHIIQTSGPENVDAVHYVATASTVLPQNGIYSIDFNFDVYLEKYGHFFFYLDKLERDAGSVGWYLVSNFNGLGVRAWSIDGQQWNTVGQRYYLVTSPPISIAAEFAPENVINGLTRSFGSISNEWVSNPALPFPQWIQFDFDQPKPVNFVQIIFDTNLYLPRPSTQYDPKTVSKYEVQIRSGGVWITVASIDGNYHRLRRHAFPTALVDAVKINVLATNGDRSARIYEVRIY